jgi:hypothetical protein
MIPMPPSAWPLKGRFHCVDPVTLTGLALAGAGGFMASQAAQTPATPAAPTPPPAPAAPAQQPQQRSAVASQQPTFLGSAAVPQQTGTKTLLGQ